MPSGLGLAVCLSYYPWKIRRDIASNILAEGQGKSRLQKVRIRRHFPSQLIFSDIESSAMRFTTLLPNPESGFASHPLPAPEKRLRAGWMQPLRLRSSSRKKFHLQTNSVALWFSHGKHHFERHSGGPARATQQEADANYRSLNQEAVYRIARTFEIDSALTGRRDQRLIDEALASGLETVADEKGHG